MSDGGKGDTQRPTDKKAYDENHERIFGEMPWYKRRDNEQQQQQKDQQS